MTKAKSSVNPIRLSHLGVKSLLFEITERYLEIRGTGDLSRAGNKQHAIPDHLIKNNTVSLKHIEWAVKAFERLNSLRGH